MTGAEIGKLIGKTLVLRNTVSGREYSGMLMEGGQRVLKPLEGVSVATTAQGLYHGGDPVLMGESGYEISGDAIITSDGLRTITSTLYQKDGKIVAARDVDAGRVKFEITAR